MCWSWDVVVLRNLVVVLVLELCVGLDKCFEDGAFNWCLEWLRIWGGLASCEEWKVVVGGLAEDVRVKVVISEVSGGL